MAATAAGGFRRYFGTGSPFHSLEHATMALKHNGWQRLWLLVSSIYFILVCVYVVIEFPQPKGLSHEKELVTRLSPQSKSFLVTEDKEGWQFVGEVGTEVDIPNGSRLSFRKGVAEKDIAAVSKEYRELISSKTNERRWSLIGFGAIWWLVPSIALYVFGWCVGWIYRGFQNK